MKHLSMRLLTLSICALAVSLITARAQQPQKIVKEGIEIEFTVEPPGSSGKKTDLMAGQDAVFRFKIRDTTTKTPLSGVKPAAWAAQRERPGAPGPDQCRAKVNSYLQGSLRSRPDVDLNSYYVLALNQESNISVIDPLLGFGGSKLLTLVLLKSPGDDWALTANGAKLFVSMPEVNQVAVVDTTTWKVVKDIDTGTRPTRVALQPDEKYLWVGDEAGVTVIDTSSLKVTKRIATGAGHHEIVLGPDNKFAFVTNRDDGTLSIIDVAKLKKLKDVKTGGRASSLAFSPLSKALYVTNDFEGTVAVVDARSHSLLASVTTKPGIKSVRFAPGGRWGFAPNHDRFKYLYLRRFNQSLSARTACRRRSGSNCVYRQFCLRAIAGHRTGVGHSSRHSGQATGRRQISRGPECGGNVSCVCCERRRFRSCSRGGCDAAHESVGQDDLLLLRRHGRADGQLSKLSSRAPGGESCGSQSSRGNTRSLCYDGETSEAGCLQRLATVGFATRGPLFRSRGEV